MKILQAFAIVFLSIILFVAMFFSLQGIVLSRTLYNTDYVQKTVTDYHLAKVLSKEISFEVTNQLTHNLSERIPLLHPPSLTQSMEAHLGPEIFEPTVATLITGIYTYYFGDSTTLPTVPIDFFKDYLFLAIDATSNQLGSTSLAQNLNTALKELHLEKVFNLPTFPENFDLHNFIVTFYGDKNNPITALRSLTQGLPKSFLLVLLPLLIGLPIIYYFLRQTSFSLTLHFFSLTGLLAILLNILIYSIFYWFAPTTTWMQPASYFPLPISKELSAFLDYSLSRFILTGLHLSFFLLIFFLVLFLLTEIYTHYYPSEEKPLSSRKKIGALSLTLLVLWFQYHYGLLIINAINNYHLLLTDFAHPSLKLSIDALISSFLP